MNLRSKTFCILPWIEKFQNVDGKRYLCCHSAVPINPNESDHIRTKIANQEPVPHCESCYKLDQQRTISPRLQETARWLKKTQVKSYIEQWKPGDPDRTRLLHGRYGGYPADGSDLRSGDPLAGRRSEPRHALAGREPQVDRRRETPRLQGRV